MQHLGWIIPLAVAVGLTLAALGRHLGNVQQAADDGEGGRNG